MGMRSALDEREIELSKNNGVFTVEQTILLDLVVVEVVEVVVVAAAAAAIAVVVAAVLVVPMAYTNL